MPTTLFVVARPNGTWEARESFRTESGPRSRTLATFRELTPEVEERVVERSSKPLDVTVLRSKAIRAGAPVSGPEEDRSAEVLLRQIALGRRPRPALAALLQVEFGDEVTEHHLDRMKLWAGASKQQRAEALEDLLSLGDALPAGQRSAKPGFPKVRSN